VNCRPVIPINGSEKQKAAHDEVGGFFGKNQIT
jgi:hypothetical protein